MKCQKVIRRMGEEDGEGEEESLEFNGQSRPWWGESQGLGWVAQMVRALSNISQSWVQFDL